MTATAKKVKTVASVFELPKKLGVLQYVEYEPPPKEWCTSEGCLYEGVLSAEGCKRGICVRYRVWVHSKDGSRWEAKERWRRRRSNEDVGGCIRQQVADALWELAGRFEVGLWYECGGPAWYPECICGVVVNGVKLNRPYCRTVEECVDEILRDYRREVEGMREPPKPAVVIRTDPVEELLKEWPELQAFGVDWVRKWLVPRDRLVEIAKVLRRFPWMVEVMKQRPMSILHPYAVEVYVTKDRSEACLSLSPPKAFCAQNGAVKETKLELEFKRYETYEKQDERGVPPQGTAGLHHGGERIRKTTLTALSPPYYWGILSRLNTSA